MAVYGRPGAEASPGEVGRRTDRSLRGTDWMDECRRGTMGRTDLLPKTW
jgi:hypothetical protein